MANPVPQKPKPKVAVKPAVKLPQLPAWRPASEKTLGEILTTVKLILQQLRGG